jgi:hypothetical protein
MTARLCPTTLPYELGTQATFEVARFNGRALGDDVMDVMLTLATNTPIQDGAPPDARGFAGTSPISACPTRRKSRRTWSLFVVRKAIDARRGHRLLAVVQRWLQRRGRALAMHCLSTDRPRGHASTHAGLEFAASAGAHPPAPPRSPRCPIFPRGRVLSRWGCQRPPPGLGSSLVTLYASAYRQQWVHYL